MDSLTKFDIKTLIGLVKTEVALLEGKTSHRKTQLENILAKLQPKPLQVITINRPDGKQHCMAGRDGDCNAIDCPQLKDRQITCPLPWWNEEDIY